MDASETASVLAAPTASAGMMPKEATEVVTGVADASVTDGVEVESMADVVLSATLVTIEASSVVDVAISTAVLDCSPAFGSGNKLVSPDLASNPGSGRRTLFLALSVVPSALLPPRPLEVSADLLPLLVTLAASTAVDLDISLFPPCPFEVPWG